MSIKQFLHDVLIGRAGEDQKPAQDRQSEKAFAEDVWLEVQKQTLLGSVKKIEEGAKQLITLATFLGGAYFAAVSFSKLGAVESPYLRALFVAPLVLWSIAIGLAVPAIVPTRLHELNLGDALSSKLFLVHFVSNNVRLLRFALTFQLLGIAAMMLVLWAVISGWVTYSNEPVRLGSPSVAIIAAYRSRTAAPRVSRIRFIPPSLLPKLYLGHRA